MDEDDHRDAGLAVETRLVFQDDDAVNGLSCWVWGSQRCRRPQQGEAAVLLATDVSVDELRFKPRLSHMFHMQAPSLI